MQFYRRFTQKSVSVEEHISNEVRKLTGKQIIPILGAQRGDEGKGKLADILAKHGHIVARFNGGANAGHTLKINGNRYALHALPCGVFHPHVTNVIGNGTVLNIPDLFKEIDSLVSAGVTLTPKTLKISDRASIVCHAHKLVDQLCEKKAGSKKSALLEKELVQHMLAKQCVMD